MVEGIAETGFGIALVFASGRKSHEAAVCLAFVAFLTSIQILPFVSYSRQKTPKSNRSKSDNSLG